MNKTKFIFSTIIALLFAIVSGLAVKAEDNNKRPLAVTPSMIEISSKPGQKIQKEFIISNNSDLAVRMKISSKDYRTTDETGKVEFYEKEGVSMNEILIPEFLELGLNPHQEKKVRFIIVIPENFDSGGHYGAVVFEKADEKISGPKTAFGELILLTVLGNNGAATAGAKITGFAASHFSLTGPVRFVLDMENSGNTHLKTKGNIAIKNWRGKEIANVNLGEQIVYPGSERTFRWRWNKTPGFGFYRAELNLAAAGKDQQKIANKSWFIIFPWKSALLVAIPLALLLAGRLWKFRKRDVYVVQPTADLVSEI